MAIGRGMGGLIGMIRRVGLGWGGICMRGETMGIGISVGHATIN